MNRIKNLYGRMGIRNNVFENRTYDHVTIRHDIITYTKSNNLSQ